SVTGPCQMFGKALGLVSVAQPSQTRQMVGVQSPRPANGQANPVDREWMIRPYRSKLRVGQPTRTHVILGMHLDKADPRRTGTDRAEMLRFEAHSGQRRKRG